LKRKLDVGKKPKAGLGFQVFTEDELYDIHMATLEVLERTGLFFDDEEALEVLDGGGAVIDKKNRVAKFPAQMVEDAIESAPSTILLAGRNPKHDYAMERNRVGFTNFGEGVHINDLYTGELRGTTKADVAASALICDYLSEIDVYERAVGAGDMPPQTVQLHNAEAWLTNTSKHGFMGPGNGYLAQKIVDMAAAIAGGRDKLQQRPIISFITCPVSPLKFIKDSCEIIMETARAGLAINVLSMAMAGGSSPVTLAGTLVDHNAEVLGGLVLSQCTRKGTKFIYGSSTTAMDLRWATASVGSPECALINAAVAQMSIYYLLPSWVAGG
jgi:trimethylamine--corrinoid protein Co-methyltransferase